MKNIGTVIFGIITLFFLLNLIAGIVVGAVAAYSFIFTGDVLWLTGTLERYMTLGLLTILSFFLLYFTAVLDD